MDGALHLFLFFYLFCQLESDLDVKARDFNTTFTMSVYISFMILSLYIILSLIDRLI